jgi:recombination protein U
LNTYANRGMTLEAMIEFTNRTYISRGWAVVHKRPTPVKILRTQGSRIVSAFLEAPSTVDYEGVYKGRSLQFEAKLTKLERLPLANFHPHQIEHLRLCAAVGAVAFCIVEFVSKGTIFFVPAQLVTEAWDQAKRGGPKSLSFHVLASECPVIPASRGVPVDYLAVVDQVLESRSA